MKIANALKKLQKAGFTVTENGQFFTAKKAGLVYYVQFTRNGGSDSVATIGVRRNGATDDWQSDYCATSFCDSMKEAIEWCLSRTATALAPGGSIHPPIVTTAADVATIEA